MNNTYFGEFILSKVIEQNDVTALTKHAITEEDFVTQGEKDVYRFIMDYANSNRNHCPDYRTVTAEFDNFNFRPDIQDSYEFLASQLKSYATQIRVQNFMQTKAMPKFEELNGLDFIDFMTEELSYIKQRADYRTKIGTDMALDADSYLAEYENRKAGKSFKAWKSAFPSMPEYLSSNMYTWYARSGRGKSVFTMVEALESAMQGATVLIWAMEMSKFEWLSRAYAYVSAKAKLTTSIQNGEEVLSGFDANALMRGQLDEPNKAMFKDFLRNINTIIKGKLIIRAVDDMDFHQRGCKQLEGDILQTKADVVVIDPIYYMTFEANTSKVAGGDVANTSKRLRQIAGAYQVVMHVITQAEEVKDDKDEDGNRELRVPVRAEIKKTKAVLEDASMTIGLDTCDGQFRIELGKGRQGGEGDVIEGIYLPAVGLVCEPQLNEFAKMAESYGF
jgi:replicative DNA helicase